MEETFFELWRSSGIFWVSIWAMAAVVIVVAMMRRVWKKVIEPQYKDYIAALDRINEKIDQLSKKGTKAHEEHLDALRQFNRGGKT